MNFNIPPGKIGIRLVVLITVPMTSLAADAQEIPTGATGFVQLPGAEKVPKPAQGGQRHYWCASEIVCTKQSV